jgi:hypothetical protein
MVTHKAVLIAEMLPFATSPGQATASAAGVVDNSCQADGFLPLELIMTSFSLFQSVGISAIVSHPTQSWMSAPKGISQPKRH